MFLAVFAQTRIIAFAVAAGAFGALLRFGFACVAIGFAGGVFARAHLVGKVFGARGFTLALVAQLCGAFVVRFARLLRRGRRRGCGRLALAQRLGNARIACGGFLPFAFQFHAGGLLFQRAGAVNFGQTRFLRAIQTSLYKIASQAIRLRLLPLRIGGAAQGGGFLAQRLLFFLRCGGQGETKDGGKTQTAQARHGRKAAGQRS